MSEISMSQDALKSFGVRTESDGVTVSVSGGQGQFDVAAMSVVFGLIGSDFMAAASTVISRHHEQIGELGADYTETGRAVIRAVDSLLDTDSASGDRFTPGQAQ